MASARLSPTQERGRQAERFIASVMLRQDWVVLTYNYALPRMGEIDLIAQQGQDVVFVEVKARQALDGTAAFGGAAYAIDAGKRHRFERCAQAWLKNHAGESWRPHLLAALVQWDAFGQICGYELRPW